MAINRPYFYGATAPPIDQHGQPSGNHSNPPPYYNSQAPPGGYPSTGGYGYGTGYQQPPAAGAGYPYPPAGSAGNGRELTPFVNVNQLTREEMALMKECARESFWRRSLPFSALGVLAVSSAHVIGMLPKTWYHYVISAGLGYVAGKISYVPVCKEKFRHLKNSPLADALNKNDRMKEMQLFHDMNQIPGFSSMPELQRDDMSYHGYDNGELYHDPEFSTSTQLSGDSGPSAEHSTRGRSKRPTTTYEELRWKNREQYWRQRGFQNQPPTGQEQDYLAGPVRNTAPSPNHQGMAHQPLYTTTAAPPGTAGIDQSGADRRQSPSSYW